MGDMGDMFREYREVVKSRKMDRVTKTIKQLDSQSIKYTMDNNYTIRLKTKLGVVLFYPTTGKYQYKKLVKRGDVNSALQLAKSLGLIE